MRTLVAGTGVWLLSGALLLSGCKGTPAPAPAAPVAATQPQQPIAVRNQDGSITNPDGSVTYLAGSPQAQQAEAPVSGSGGTTTSGAKKNADGSVTYPAGTTASSVARREETRPRVESTGSADTAGQRSAPAEQKALVVPTGTRVAVSLSQTLSASKNNAGDSFSGVLAQPLTTAGGAVAFPRGTAVEGTVVAAKGRGRFKGAGALGIELTSIGGRRVSTSEYEKAQAGKGKRTGVLVGGGTGLGAIIGGIAGGGKGALIGGLAGAGAGTAGAAYTGNKDVVIPAETVVSFRLSQPLNVREGSR